MAESYGIEFFETSAKEDRNIKEAFYYLAREIKEKVLVDSKTAGTNPAGTQLGGKKEK